jgi:predicted N-acyltransferase
MPALPVRLPEPVVTAQPDLQLHARFIDSIAAVEPAAWDAICGSDYPFLRHAFLLALESSGCTSRRSGWRPQHLLLENGAGVLQGCLPLYLKDNSFGEYVFDWSWADAYRRHGLDYYPKLLSAVPFTPCAGPRLCLAPGVATSSAMDCVLRAIQAHAAAIDASSWHLLFPLTQNLQELQREGLLLRTGCQYQWFNQNYRSFDDFLASLNSRKRKNLRKERARVADSGIRFARLRGNELTPELWETFYGFYANTYLVRGRAPYLNLEFFQALGRSMPDALLLVLALKDDAPVAGALCFTSKDTLYGRYWGCSNEHQFLHFETCYYQGIEYCIEQGIARFDSGAQGEHKIQRGFQPVPTWSLHWIAHPQFHEAIARFVEDEARHVSHYLQHAAEFLPFRRDLLPTSPPAPGQTAGD